MHDQEVWQNDVKAGEHRFNIQKFEANLSLVCAQYTMYNKVRQIEVHEQ